MIIETKRREVVLIDKFFATAKRTVILINI